MKALIVLDAQQIYTDAGSDLKCKDSSRTIERINKLIESFDRDQSPIILVRHIHKCDGTDLGRMFDYLGEVEDFNFKEGTAEVDYDQALKRPSNAIEIVKTRYSAFAGTKLLAILRKAKIDTLTVCGFMTNCCCDSTAREAHDNDFFVDFIIDATGTPGTDTLSERDIRKVTAELMQAGYAKVLTTRKYLSS
jgi:nicotinamidase-related amidase